ncbi:MAG: hypothetical protein JO272_04150 [Pseudonocardiales bacterium]|nr:hypothetical protein [Pseudonocardiales bacterium]
MTRQARLGNLGLGSVGLATGRVAIGVVALLRPALVARPWVGGAQASAPAGVVLGRALGGRDLALGAGALLAAWCGDERALRAWTLAGAFCDGVDAVATAASWRDLPALGRLAVAGAATAGAVLGGSTVLRAARR